MPPAIVLVDQYPAIEVEKATFTGAIAEKSWFHGGRDGTNFLLVFAAPALVADLCRSHDAAPTRYSSPDSSAALPPAAAVLMVTVCSVAKRAR